MPYSYAITTASGLTQVVTVPCPYLAKADIFVKVDNVLIPQSGYSWNSSAQIALPAGTLTAGEVVRVYRQTPVANPVTVLASPSVLPTSDINLQFLQTLYGVQEALDRAEEAYAVAGDTAAGILDDIAQMQDLLAQAQAAATAASGSASLAETARIAAQLAAVQAGLGNYTYTPLPTAADMAPVGVSLFDILSERVRLETHTRPGEDYTEACRRAAAKLLEAGSKAPVIELVADKDYAVLSEASDWATRAAGVAGIAAHGLPLFELKNDNKKVGIRGNGARLTSAIANENTDWMDVVWIEAMTGGVDIEDFHYVQQRTTTLVSIDPGIGSAGTDFIIAGGGSKRVRVKGCSSTGCTGGIFFTDKEWATNRGMPVGGCDGNLIENYRTDGTFYPHAFQHAGGDTEVLNSKLWNTGRAIVLYNASHIFFDVHDTQGYNADSVFLRTWAMSDDPVRGNQTLDIHGRYKSEGRMVGNPGTAGLIMTEMRQWSDLVNRGGHLKIKLELDIARSSALVGAGGIISFVKGLFATDGDPVARGYIYELDVSGTISDWVSGYFLSANASAGAMGDMVGVDRATIKLHDLVLDGNAGVLETVIGGPNVVVMLENIRSTGNLSFPAFDSKNLHVGRHVNFANYKSFYPTSAVGLTIERHPGGMVHLTGRLTTAAATVTTFTLSDVTLQQPYFVRAARVNIGGDADVIAQDISSTQFTITQTMATAQSYNIDIWGREA